MSKKTVLSNVKRPRISVTIDEDRQEQIKYWAARNQMSENEFLLEAIDLMIRHQNKDYDLPSLEIARLNQLVDVVTVLSQDIQSLETVTITGFDSLIGLAKGNNYLIESEDGIID